MTVASNPPDSDRRDRLLRLLPQVLQMSDAVSGGALQALLRILAEQADVVEDDIAALLDNWFIETCDDWATPYIAELVGYKPVLDVGQFGDVQTLRDHQRMRLLAPRAEAANTLRFRRRKGTLLVLEEIAQAVSGWPTRAVECRLNIAAAWHARFPKRVVGRTLDLHNSGLIARAGGPFDTTWRHTDLRRLASTQAPGLGSPNGLLLWAWRLKPQGVKQGEAGTHCSDGDYRRFTFDPFGLDVPLFTLPQTLPNPTQPAGELQVPAPILRCMFREHPADYYGPDRSLYLWRGQPTWGVLIEDLRSADLCDWNCPLQTGQIAVDTQRGRILCRWDDDELGHLLKLAPPNAALDDDDEPDLWVHYYSGCSADIGGGSYRRAGSTAPADVPRWQVGRALKSDHKSFSELSDALEAWTKLDTPRRVVIEIEDDLTYGLGLHGQHKRRTMHFHDQDYLEIRAANGCRPAIVPGEADCSGYEWRFGHKDDKFTAGHGATVILDGLRLADLTVVLGHSARQVQLRDTTLTPGRTTLQLQNFTGKVEIERCILGAIETQHVYDGSLAPRVHVQDSILDGAGKPAFGAAGSARKAYIRLRAERVTVFGAVRIYEIDFAADSLFADTLEVEVWERGLLRYCSINAATALTAPSPTPPRYGCQPDRAAAGLTGAAREQEIGRIVPHFRSRRYGDPAYAQLASTCPPEIARGAEDESEMGAFHDLYQPQREALLLARLAEYTLAQADARLIYAT